MVVIWQTRKKIHDNIRIWRLNSYVLEDRGLVDRLQSIMERFFSLNSRPCSFMGIFKVAMRGVIISCSGYKNMLRNAERLKILEQIKGLEQKQKCDQTDGIKKSHWKL